MAGSAGKHDQSFSIAPAVWGDKLPRQTAMKFLKDADATLEPLEGKTVAVLGYGNQGRAQGLNLRDSGVTVIVGNRDDAYRQQAIADGFQPMSIREAAEVAEVLLVLT